MKYLPTEARCVFVDGPVAIFIHEAPSQAILDAYERLGRVVAVAAQQLNKEDENAIAQPRHAITTQSLPPRNGGLA